MSNTGAYATWRLAPLILVVIAAAFWMHKVQDGGPYVWRNVAPLFLLLVIAALTLYRGEGRWSGSGMRMPLGTLGFAIPALGLALYLHYAYSVNLNDMFTDAEFPQRVFRYLPIYTSVAGGVGFAIGWIVGRNL